MMIHNIIFDLGGVLIDWNPRYVFRKVFDSDEKTEWFLSNICTMAWNEQQDAGRTLKDATEQLQMEFPQWHNEIGLYYGQWEEMLGGPINDSVDLLSNLKRNNTHNLFALTNWSSETFPIALERFDFLSWFQGIVVSGHEKCIKPDRKIYQILLDRYSLKAENSVFIDDNKRNVAGALSIGMKAIHYKDTPSLKESLSELGIRV